jgi:hypothetical protein
MSTNLWQLWSEDNPKPENNGGDTEVSLLLVIIRKWIYCGLPAAGLRLINMSL